MTRLCTCTESLASQFELSRKGNQLTKVSCKTCGGRPLVNGMGPASLLNTAGLELTDFLDPDLSWKTLTKGRRSRKPSGRSFNIGAKLSNKSPKKVWGSSVSESEKLGVAILGKHFSDKAGHIPIKKRIRLLRSPSPPPRTPSQHCEEALSCRAQTPSPHSEDSEHKCPLGQLCCPNSFSRWQMRGFAGSKTVKFGDGIYDRVIDDSVFEVSNKLLHCTEDFSGIALLAAAACISSIADEAENGEEDLVAQEFSISQVVDSSASTTQLEEHIASTGIGKNFQEDLVNEDNLDGSFVLDNSITVSENHHATKDDSGEVTTVPSKDDRLQWDLNTEMDAWDKPFDISIVDFQRNVSSAVDDDMQRETLEKFQGKTQRDSEVIKQSAVESMRRKATADVDEVYLVLDPKDEGTGPPISNIEGHFLEACSDNVKVCIEEKCICISNGHALEPLNNNSDDKKASGQVVSIEASLYYPPSPVSHHISSTPVSEETKIDTASASISGIRNSEDCCSPSALQLSKITSSESVLLRKCDISVVNVPVKAKAACEYIIQSEDNEDFGKTSGLPDTRISPTVVISTTTCNTLDVENPICNSNKEDPSHLSRESEDLFVSGTSVVREREAQFIVFGDAKCQDEKTVAANADFTVHVGAKESMSQGGNHVVSNGGLISHESCTSCTDKPTSCSCGIALPFDDCYDGKIPRNDIGHMVCAENMTQLQVGYDSPFEDGELREACVYSCEEESECLDYESDIREGDYFDESVYPVPEKVEVGCEDSQVAEEKGSSLVTKVTKTDFHEIESVKTTTMQLRGGHLSIIDDTKDREMVGKEGLDAGSSIAVEQSASILVEVNNDSSRRSHSSDHMNGLNVKGLDVREVGIRASSRKLLCVEGPPIVGVLERKDTAQMQRGRSHNLGGSYSRVEKDFDSVTSMGRDRSFHVRERNEENDYWVDSSVDHWDSRRRYPPNCRDSYTRPSVLADSSPSVGGLNCRDHHKQFSSVSSRGVYRPPLRRRSPVDREDYDHVHRGLPPMRGIRGDRSRGRSGKYLQGIRMGPREGNHDHVPGDGFASSVRMPHFSARRDRSFSPTFTGGDYISRPRRKSRSRSRTRSPPAWHLQREQNLGRRRDSRSPDFRFEPRMERTRFAFRKPSFATDYEESFVYPPRGRFSPRQDSRWVDDQNCVDGHSRDRRSPVRNFMQSQRFNNSVNYSGRLKSDGNFRPVIRPGRFPLMAGSGGGRKYGDSEDGKRHDDRGGIIHRAKQYDTQKEYMRRFRFDEEDYKDDCDSSDPRGDVSRSLREERSFRFNNNRM